MRRISPISTSSRLIRDIGGVSIVEFALVAPVVLLLLFAEYALCDAMSAKRKLTIATHTIGDLVARQTSVTSASLATYLSAASQIAAPYNISNMTIRIAELSTDNTGKTWVTWSSALNTTGLTTGVQFTLPAGLAQNNTSLIYSSSTYQFTPLLGASLFGTMTFTSQFYTYPRITTAVTYSN